MTTGLGCPKCGGPVHKGGIHSAEQGKTGRQRYRCRPCKWHGTQPIGLDEAKSAGVDPDVLKSLAKRVRKARGVQRYVITAAQNATPVNKRFFASLLTYCKVRDAQLLVIPYRYKNPTSMWTAAAQDDDWWAP